ncbi:unnamed protein product [Clonostachys solani]|uniref:Uncharacterized protein n=1 Tax=Clonostachys solani TaxID=160281 RepID=A0A9N9W3W5_9HYPO|nr:unnamed protein product [Clonostachys solani]
MSAGGGFQFVVTTASNPRVKENQRLVRSHISRSRSSRKGPRTLTSWINHDVGLSEQDQHDDGHVEKTSLIRPLGNGLSWIRFPDKVHPRIIQKAASLLPILGNAMYPKELCIEEPTIDAAWVGLLLSDAAYIHAMAYSAEAYHDKKLSRQPTAQTQAHLVEALRLLQSRLSKPNSSSATSDPTIMTIVMLALAADVLGDWGTLESHLEGLKVMVNLRGGLPNLKTTANEIAFKICRGDLSHALRNSRRPIYFRDNISWEPYITGSSHTSLARFEDDKELSRIIQSLDTRLYNVWTDLREFCQMANLGCQTGLKLPHGTFNEILLSVSYRLSHLAFDRSPALEAFRVGMLAFATSIFFSWPELRAINVSVNRAFQDALWKLRSSGDQFNPLLTFWVLMVWKVQVHKEAPEKLFADWFGEVKLSIPIASWAEARAVMKRVLWIDILYDGQGKAEFNRSI